MRAAILTGALFALGISTGLGNAAEPVLGMNKTFQDWIAACDNGLSCVGIGLQSQEDGEAYAVLRRAAGPTATPSLSLHLILPDGSHAKEVTVTGTGGAGFGPRTYPASSEESVLGVRVPEADLAPLTAVIRDGSSLTLTAGGSTETISLRGAAAALLAIDDAQGRVGTVTALARPGTGPASSVPAGPALPRSEGKALRSLGPVPPRPAAIKVTDDPSCQAIDDIAIDLGGGMSVRGVCDYAAAYNTGFRFWLVNGKSAKPLSFQIPGIEMDDPAVLANPSVAKDGHTLEAYDLGRGLGDCGDRQSWAWTGSAFVLTAYASMDPCAGVMPEDWPVLYRSAP